MALLGDLLFPDPTIREYFTGEMGGRLEVETDYDAINVTLQGKASEYDRIVDVLRGGVVATPLTPENLAKVRDARIKKLAETKASPGEIAESDDCAPVAGGLSIHSPRRRDRRQLKKIFERGDVMLARNRLICYLTRRGFCLCQLFDYARLEPWQDSPGSVGSPPLRPARHRQCGHTQKPCLAALR